MRVVLRVSTINLEEKDALDRLQQWFEMCKENDIIHLIDELALVSDD